MHERRRAIGSPSEPPTLWEKIDAALSRYRLLVWAVGGLLLAVGFDFQTPASKFAAVNAQVAQVRGNLQGQIDTLKLGRDRQERMMEFTVRYICSKLTVAQRYELGGTSVCGMTERQAP